MKTEKPKLVEKGPAIEQSGLVHRVWEPTASGPHPTIVMIHGRKGNEDVTWVFERTLPDEWLLVAPRAPFVEEDGFSWDESPTGLHPPLRAFDNGVQALERFVSSLPDLYDSDLSRLYLLAFSQGAAMAYTFTMRNNFAVRGIAALVGLIAADAAKHPEISNLRDVPVFMAVGRKDDTVPLSVARSCAHAVIAGGARLDYREYDTGHKLNVRGMRDLSSWWLRETNS